MVHQSAAVPARSVVVPSVARCAWYCIHLSCIRADIVNLEEEIREDFFFSDAKKKGLRHGYEERVLQLLVQLWLLGGRQARWLISAGYRGRGGVEV